MVAVTVMLIVVMHACEDVVTVAVGEIAGASSATAFEMAEGVV